MAEPHLHTPDVDAALDKSRGAGVTPDVRHDLVIGAKSDLGFRLVPDGTELCLAELGEWAFRPTAFGRGQLGHLLDRSVIGVVRLRPDLVIQKETRCSWRSFQISLSASPRRQPLSTRKTESL